VAANRPTLNSDKSAVDWVGLARTLHKPPGPEVKVGPNIIQASDNVKLLRVGISADLTFDRHFTKIAGQCFYQLRQLRSVPQ
jgi:hypothetical protein